MHALNKKFARLKTSQRQHKWAKVIILSILLYGAEIWTLKQTDENRLLTMEIMGITKLDKVRNTIIRETLGAQETVINKVSTKRLKIFWPHQQNATR